MVLHQNAENGHHLPAAAPTALATWLWDGKIVSVWSRSPAGGSQDFVGAPIPMIGSFKEILFDIKDECRFPRAFSMKYSMA